MNKTALILISFFTSTIVYGQNHPQTLLWKVTKKGNKNASYLFGTFHEVSPSFFNTLSNAVSKLQQSEILFVEQRSDAKAALHPGAAWTAAKWKALLTPEQQELFTAFVNKADDTAYYRLNPLLLSLTMARLYLVNFCEADTSFTQLMDQHIEAIAAKEQQPVYSLDSNQNSFLNTTAESFTTRQDSLYASFGIKYMKSMLENNLEHCAILTAYKNFDIDYQLDKEITSKSPDYSLLVSRNKSWIPLLDKAFSVHRCFVAVGFRHLFYQQGLIQQLRKLGYTVEPIPVRN